MIRKETSLEALNNLNKNTMLAHLGIQVTELGDDYIVGTMPVDNRTIQTIGLLHGGASVALMETLGSIGSSLIVDLTQHGIVGLEINANHIRGKKSGMVTGKAKIVHSGRTTHIWQIDIRDEENRLISTGRLTTLVTNIK